MSNVSEIDHILHYVIALAVLALTIYAGRADIIDRLRDILGKDREPFFVKSTSIKEVMRPDATETCKLRQIRVLKTLNKISIDHVPELYFTARNKPPRTAVVSDHYSMPGRTQKSADQMFEILFMDDELLTVHQNHALFLSYTVKEDLDEVHDNPSITIRQPVGKGCLTYEPHFQADRTYKKREGSLKPDLKVWVTDERGNRRALFPSKDYIANGGSPLDFNDGNGPTEWFRVRFPRPPQYGDITIEWEWAQLTTNKPQGSSSAPTNMGN